MGPGGAMERCRRGPQPGIRAHVPPQARPERVRGGEAGAAGAPTRRARGRTRCPRCCRWRASRRTSGGSWTPPWHHPLELQLIHENLSSFAADLGVYFQFTVFNIDTRDSATPQTSSPSPVVTPSPFTSPSAQHTQPQCQPSSTLSSDSAPRSSLPSNAAATASELPFAAHLFQAF
ncbi:hypothetical protein ACQ4PT_060653 [Festuca glaucescens]